MKTSIPTTVKTLQALGFLAVIVAAGCLINSDIYMAFLLGAFLVSLISIILLFGFSKVIQVLGEIRDKAAEK